MTEARAAAEGAGARTHVASAFDKAWRAGQDADRLLKARRFADAASRYYEASGLYHGAEVGARSRASALEAASRPASAPQPAPEHLPAPAVTVPASTPPPAPTVAAPVSPPAPALPPAAAPTPAPAPEAAPPPVPEERIGELIDRYKEALEARSFDQLKRVWPSLSGPAESAMRQEFKQATRITVEIGDPRISVAGGSGTATFIRKYTVVTVEGQRLQSTTQAAMDVRRTGNSWVIDAIRFSPR
jgi:hypothetical protein